MASIDMNNEKEVLEKVKKKMRENHEVNKESKETFAVVNEKDNEPKITLYGDRAGSRHRSQDRNKSRDREFWKDGKSYSHGGDRGRSRERRSSRDSRRSWGNNSRSKDRRSHSKDHRRDRSFQKDGKSQDTLIKRTYKVEKLNLDNEKSVFENEIENRMLID